MCAFRAIDFANIMRLINTIVLPYIFTAIVSSGYAQPAMLDVGDTAPKLSVFRWIKGTPVDDWSPDRMYVLEFGATWCGPCAAAMPALSDIAERYRGQVEVISLFVMELNTNTDSISPAYVNNVERYVMKNNGRIKYTVGVDSPQRHLEYGWLKKAGLNGVPYMFLIDRAGKIAWIGGSMHELEKQIIIRQGGSLKSRIPAAVHRLNASALQHSTLQMHDNASRKGSDVLFRSVLTRYEGQAMGESMVFVQSAHWLKPDTLYDKYEDKVEVFGGSIGQFYYMAYADTFSNQVPTRNYWLQYPDTLKNPYTNNSYGKYWYEPILEVNDTSPFLPGSGSTTNRYNYLLQVPKGCGSSAYLQAVMRRDLDTYFGYDVAVETRPMPVWVVTAPDHALALSKLRSKDQTAEMQILSHETHAEFRNGDMRDIIWMLGSNYGYGTYDYGKVPGTEQAPFIDGTGIKDKIDFTFNRNLSFEQIKDHLALFGLKVMRGKKEMKVVVIRDPDL